MFSKKVASVAGRSSWTKSVAAGRDPGEDVKPAPGAGKFRLSLFGLTNSLLTPNHKGNTKKQIHILQKQSSGVFTEQWRSVSCVRRQSLSDSFHVTKIQTI